MGWTSILKSALDCFKFLLTFIDKRIVEPKLKIEFDNFNDLKIWSYVGASFIRKVATLHLPPTRPLPLLLFVAGVGRYASIMR